MNNSKLLRILNVCTKEEIKGIEKCINSPFFNENPDVIRFWQYIKANLSKETSSKLQKEHVFQRLFPKESYNDPKMRRLMSGLVKIIEQFLFLQSNQGTFLYKQNLTQIFYERYLDAEFEGQLTELILENERSGKKNATYYENQVLIEKYKMYAAFKQFRLKKGNEDRNLLETLKSRDRAYLIGQLNLFCAFLNNKSFFQHKEYEGFLDNIIDFYQQKYQDAEDEPILYMYLSIKNILSNKHHSKEKIINISKYLSKNGHFFDHNEIAFFAAILRSIVNRFTKQDASYKEVLFELYKEHLDNGSLLNYNKISAEVYMGIVSLAVELDEVLWVENFIPKYNKHVPISDQESVLYLSKALLTFYRKAYQEALYHLIQTEKVENPFFELRIRVLWLKVQYHLNDIDALIMAENRLKAYIQRTTSLSKLQKKAYQNFLSLFQKISKHAHLSISQKKRLVQRNRNNASTQRKRMAFTYLKMNQNGENTHFSSACY